MEKREFLEKLRAALAGLPQGDIEERLSFYGEAIDDRMEEGMTEAEAVAAVGAVGEIVPQILSDVPLGKLVRERIKPKRTLRAWEIVLLVLGFPVWFPLLIAFAAVVLSLYITVWAVLASLWTVEISLAACVPCALFAAALFTGGGHGLSALAALGIALFCAGVSIFWFFGCKAITKGILRLTKKALLGVKAGFVGKERSK